MLIFLIPMQRQFSYFWDYIKASQQQKNLYQGWTLAIFIPLIVSLGFLGYIQNLNLTADTKFNIVLVTFVILLIFEIYITQRIVKSSKSNHKKIWENIEKMEMGDPALSQRKHWETPITIIVLIIIVLMAAGLILSRN
jgi:quinol-cytochrome oxidoreductase complex cytochrome b subunit